MREKEERDLLWKGDRMKKWLLGLCSCLTLFTTLSPQILSLPVVLTHISCLSSSSLLFQSPSFCPNIHVSLCFCRWFVSIHHISRCLCPRWQRLDVASLTSSSSTSSQPCFPLIPLSSDHLRRPSFHHPALLLSPARLAGSEFEFYRKPLEIWFGFCSVYWEGELGFLFSVLSVFLFVFQFRFLLWVIKYMLPFDLSPENKHQYKIFGFPTTRVLIAQQYSGYVSLLTYLPLTSNLNCTWQLLTTT